MCDVLQHFASRIIWINEYDLCLVLHMLYCAMRCCAMSFNATRLYAMLYLHVLSCTVHMMLDKLPYYRSIQSVNHLVFQPFQSSNECFNLSLIDSSVDFILLHFPDVLVDVMSPKNFSTSFYTGDKVDYLSRDIMPEAGNGMSIIITIILRILLKSTINLPSIGRWRWNFSSDGLVKVCNHLHLPLSYALSYTFILNSARNGKLHEKER